MIEDRPYKYYCTFIVKQGYAFDIDLTSDKLLTKDQLKTEAIKLILDSQRPERFPDDNEDMILQRPSSEEDFTYFRIRRGSSDIDTIPA